MLVLTRKPNQSIFLWDDQLGLNFKVTFLRKGSSEQIKLGIDAPQNIKIFREEVLTPKQLSEFQLNKGDDHPNQFNQLLKGSDESLIKVCS